VLSSESIFNQDGSVTSSAIWSIFESVLGSVPESALSTILEE